MGTYQIINKKLNVQVAEAFIENVKNSAYYVFTANTSKHATVTFPEDTTRSSINIFDNMIFGKRIKDTDTFIMAKRYNWSIGTVYDMYRDDDPDLINKKFYVLVDDGTNYNVYKCLNNNYGAKSIVQPSGTESAPFESPVDGYTWKYLFTIDEFEMRRFATADFIPIVENSTVMSDAVAGSIEVITVDQNYKGLRYDNYTSGAFLFGSDIAYGNNPRQYVIEPNASDRNNFYNGCIIKITSGIGENSAINEYRLITDYKIEGGKKVIVIDRPFTGVVNQNDTYEIYPNVFIYDTSGTSTEACVARAIVNPASGNSISKIEVLNPGAGYRSVIARLEVDPNVNVQEEVKLNAIIPPTGGHGSNPNNELFGHYVGISASFIGNSAPFTIDNTYRTVGVLKDPKYANVSVKLDSPQTIGSFIKGETIYRYKPIRLFGNVQVCSNSLVISTDPVFTNSLRLDDRIVITNGDRNIFANVQTIVNSSEIVIDKTPPFIGTDCNMYLTESQAFGKVSSYSNINTLELTEVSPVALEYSTYMIGESSYCSAVANIASSSYITVNGRYADDFGAFTQLSSFVGTLTSESTFVLDELVEQDLGNEITNGRATFHSLVDTNSAGSDILYVTDVKNSFGTLSSGVTQAIVGNSSGATFTASYKYNGELVKDTGEILYLENLNPISRAYTQTETIKLILEF